MFPNYLPPVNGDQAGEIDEEEDEEELYELVSIPNGETSNMSSEAESGQSEEQIDKSEEEEKDLVSCQAEESLCPQKSIIEDIRFVYLLQLGVSFVFD